jgi:hypothetical protein
MGHNSHPAAVMNVRPKAKAQTITQAKASFTASFLFILFPLATFCQLAEPDQLSAERVYWILVFTAC